MPSRVNEMPDHHEVGARRRHGSPPGATGVGRQPTDRSAIPGPDDNLGAGPYLAIPQPSRAAPRAPAGTCRADRRGDAVIRRDRLGSLIHEYAQVASPLRGFGHPQGSARVSVRGFGSTPTPNTVTCVAPYPGSDPEPTDQSSAASRALPTHDHSLWHSGRRARAVPTTDALADRLGTLVASVARPGRGGRCHPQGRSHNQGDAHNRDRPSTSTGAPSRQPGATEVMLFQWY
jgi:pyruvate/2-oxoglutarate dehydrogenase complex dihydrolipoamide acyltransferase (E2) component